MYLILVKMIYILGIEEGILVTIYVPREEFMSTRTRKISPAWYPDDKFSIMSYIEQWQEPKREHEEAKAGVVPHASWFYSGKLAHDVFSTLGKKCDALVVVGGHMHKGSGIVAYDGDKFATPIGTIDKAEEIQEWLASKLTIVENPAGDNTVEVHLPLAMYYYPDVPVLALRAAPGNDAVELGKALADYEKQSGKSLVVIGSTDLTHYGPNFHFTSKGPAPKAIKWVKNTNDKRFIDAVCGMDAAKASALAASEQSACSAGGAVAALTFASNSGAEKGELVGYYTSYDIAPSDNIVGYAGILFV